MKQLHPVRQVSIWFVTVALAQHIAWAKQISEALGGMLNGRKHNVEKIILPLDNCIMWMHLKYSVQTCFKIKKKLLRTWKTFRIKRNEMTGAIHSEKQRGI